MITKTFSVDNIGQPEAVTLDTDCKEVEIGEDGDTPTLSWKLRRPDASSVARTLPPGKTITLRGTFSKGQTIAYVETIGGAGTFFQQEGSRNV